MAFDFSKLNFFSKLDARARVFVLFGGIIGVIAAAYFASIYFTGSTSATGPTTVASAPPGLASTPGGATTAQFAAATKRADTAAAKAAEMSGTSAVPTLVNTGMKGMGGCTVLCSDENIDVKSTINDMMSKAKLTPNDASKLSALTDKNVPAAEFGTALDDLVKNGKVDPMDARTLYDQYQKQHNYRSVQESAKVMDGYLQSGQLPLDAANKLLDAQKKESSLTDYSSLLQGMIKAGQISPNLAQALSSQYLGQLSKEATSRNIAALNQMADQGEITREAAGDLSKLIQQAVPLNRLQDKLDEMIKQGKLTPAAANKIRDQYLTQKTQPSELSSINEYLKQAIEAAYQELRDLVAEKKITQATADQIAGQITAEVDFATFSAMIKKMVDQNQLTPDIAKLKLEDYQKIVSLKALRDKLMGLQTNNATSQEYEDALKGAVTVGTITPDQGAKLLSEYQALHAAPTIVSTPGGATDAFKALQENVTSGAIAEAAKQSASPAAGGATEALSQAQLQAQKEEQQRKEARLSAMVSGMDGQAQQLISSWGPPTMNHKDRIKAVESGSSTAGGAKTAEDKNSGNASASDGSTSTTGAPLIKAGTIMFAVLDTSVNSDYPDSPVLATVVEGKYKGAKLLGRLQTTKGVSGQMDRIMLTFNLINMDQWPKSKSMTGFGIDPETARSALATNVNYHYMQRFGALMATSFLQGYGQAAMSSGGSQTQSAFGTSTTNPQLSAQSKFAVAIGQMAQAVGDATKNYTNRPPTVVVDSGVGLGILFMSDIT